MILNNKSTNFREPEEIVNKVFLLLFHHTTMRTILETTEDGSHTLYVPELEEHYHSTHGAIQESMHVFIDAGLRHCNNEHIHLLEIGFGTGLNGLLTLLEAEKLHKKLFYHSLERFPLTETIAMQLNYPEQITMGSATPPLQDEKRLTLLFHQLHLSPWERATAITPSFTLLKEEGDFSHPEQFQPSRQYELIYFDAFAPEKQPEMWQDKIFRRLYALSSDNGILTTYCAKGAVRRMLQSVGFTVERLPGPPGKRETLRATKVK